MDSCNSESLQSSSGGGDDEYDSRAVVDSISAFITSSPIPNPPPAQAPPQFFDQLSNFVHFQYQNPNTAFSGPGSLRSDPNNSMLPSFMPSFQPPPPVVADHAGSALPPPPLPNQNQTRNPRKRSRASRRAPTTVLTTDTTNFRAMVQEFTGIPSPPFSSSFPRGRLDLFGTRSTSMSGGGSGRGFQPPSYLRRPFPQKIQPPPLSFLGSCSSPIGSSTPSVNNNNLNSVPSSTDSATFQLPMTTAFDLNRSTLFTSLFKTNPKFPFSDPPLVPTKSLGVPPELIPSNDNQFDLVHGNQVSSSLNDLLHSDQPPNAADRSNLRSENGGGGFSFTMNDFSPGSSTSNFHGGEKTPENNSTAAGGRGEGMVESWICSSE